MYSTRLGMKSNPSWARWLAIVTVYTAVWGIVACGSQSDPGDSSTHFWQTCDADEECGDNYQCLCGRCTESCNRSNDCRAPQAACIAVTGLGECRLEGNVCAAPTATDEHSDAGGAASVGATTSNAAESMPTSDVAPNSTIGGSSSAGSNDPTSPDSTNSESGSDTDDTMAPTPSPWSSIIDVEPADNFAFAPLVTVDSEGNAMVMWSVGIAETGYSLMANTHRGEAGWGDEVQLATGPNFLSRQCMSSNRDGATIASWVAESETGSQLWAALFESETGWSQSTAIGAQSVQINDVGCARDAAGNATLVWTPNDGIKAMLNAARFDALVGWGEPERLDQTDANASTLSLALDGSGNALVFWNAWLGDADELWANRYVVSQGWQVPVRMPSTPGLRVLEVDLALTDTGEGVGLWSEQANDGTQSTILAIPFTSEGTWEEPEVLASGTDALSNPSVGLTGSQSAVATWEAFRSTGGVRENRIFARTKKETGWEEPVLLAEDAAWVSLASSPAGYAISAWRTPLDYMVDGDVVVARYDQQLGWGDAVVLSEDIAGDSSSIYASVNDNGQACLVWEQSVDDPGGHIMFSRNSDLSSN